MLSEFVPSRDISEIPGCPGSRGCPCSYGSSGSCTCPCSRAQVGRAIQQGCSGDQGVLSVTDEELVLLFGIQKYGTGNNPGT